MQALDVVLGHAALGAHLVYEAGDKLHHGVSHVAVLRVLEAALGVEAFGHAAGNTAQRAHTYTHKHTHIMANELLVVEWDDTAGR